jgi:YesN/AraC family two-component response regulator
MIFHPFGRPFVNCSASSRLEIVGEAADGNSAVEMTLHLVPEVIVMDVKMPHLSGVEATRRIKEVLPAIHVVGFFVTG